MILSILICGITERELIRKTLIENIAYQILMLNASDKVEVNLIVDNKGCKPTGTKRNELIDNAKGKWVIFVDDDDDVPHYFIEELLKATESDADCFATNGIITTNGANQKQWFISINNPYCASWVDGKEVYLRYPNHLTCMKREIAKQVKFPDVFVGEDYAFATELHNRGLLKTEYVIEKPMYNYKFLTNK
mgnify:CR=1 FL=1